MGYGPKVTIWNDRDGGYPGAALRLAGAGRSVQRPGDAELQWWLAGLLTQKRGIDGSASWADTKTDSAVAMWESGMNMASFLNA